MTTQEGPVGLGRVAAIAEPIAGFSPRCVMLVTDGAVYALSGARDAVGPAFAGRKAARSFGHSANPRIADVERGVAFRRPARPALIVAEGGGNDVAELIDFLGPGAASWSAPLDRREQLSAPRGPLVATPIAPRNGAGATRFAVYIGGETRLLTHPLLRPSHAIVAPRPTASLPPQLAAAGGLDALAHASSRALTVELGVPRCHAMALVPRSVLRINAEPGERQPNEPQGADHQAGAIHRLLRSLGRRDAENAALVIARLASEPGHAACIGRGGRRARSDAGCVAKGVDAERLGNDQMPASQAEAARTHATLRYLQAAGAVA